MTTLIPLVLWTRFLRVCHDISWSLIIAHVPLITNTYLFHLWNITKSHPPCFLFTSVILVHWAIISWTPFLGSLIHSEAPLTESPGCCQCNLPDCWKLSDIVWPSPTPPNTDSHPVLVPLGWSIPFLGMLSLTFLDYLNPSSTISWNI